MAKLNRLEKENLYDRVAEELRNYIIANELKPGDRLPTERDLVEQLGVSRSSVREGLRKLEILGIVEIRPKEGITVKNQDGDVTPMVEKLTFRYRTEEVSFSELLEAREAIEEVIVKLAVERATDEDLHEMKECLDMMEDKGRRGEAFANEDLRFHQAILASAKNSVLMEFGAILEEFFQARLLEHSTAIFKQSRMQQTMSEHKALYEAIKKRDSKKAVQVMRQHLEVLRETIGGEVEEATAEK